MITAFKKYRTGVAVLLVVAALGVVIRFTQDKPKNEIRILVDRVPNTLDTSQAPDTLAQRLLPLITELHYRVRLPVKYEDFILDPADSTLPPLHFVYLRDELSRAMLFQGGHADVLYDTVSIAKTAWFRKNGTQILTAPGYTISFVGFQLDDPILKNLAVRQAIQASFPVGQWTHFKLFDYADPLPEVKLIPDLKRANRLLDEAGFTKKEDGQRFTLQYITTPVREGNENAQLVREALKAIGIRVEILPIETSLFFHRLSHGDFQLFATRIYRNTASDSVSDFFGEKSVRNYFHYHLNHAPPFTWDDIKAQIFQDLPIIPLYTWRHSALLSDRVTWLPGTETKLDDSFRFLASLRLK